MTMTLREALRGEPFVQARAHVLAGLDRLDREIRWVHCSEMPQAARLFHGGELYLTQGRGLSRDEDEQRRRGHGDRRGGHEQVPWRLTRLALV